MRATLYYARASTCAVAGGARPPAERGLELVREGRFAEALEYFEGALELDAGDPDLWNGKGVALRSLGRYAESVECFERSLELDPRDRHSS